MAVAIYEPQLITRNPFARDPAIRLRAKTKPKGVQRARLKHRTIIEQQQAAEVEARWKAAIAQKTEPDLLDRYMEPSHPMPRSKLTNPGSSPSRQKSETTSTVFS